MKILYSNLLGTKLVGGIIATRAAGTSDLYNAAMDEWMGVAMKYLGAVSEQSTRKVIEALDGVWWDSAARLPQNDLVLRRYMETGERLDPWLISDAYVTPEIIAGLEQHCGGTPMPLILSNPAEFRGLKLADFATLEIQPDPKLVAHMPIDQREGVTITQADFPRLISIVHEQARAELGERVADPSR